MSKDDPFGLNRLHARALKQFNAQRFEQALRSAENLVALAKTHFGERHPAVEQALGFHAEMRHSCGEPEEAERLYREALAVRRFLVGPKSPALIPGLNQLAAINLALDRHTIAEPLAREAIDICRQLPEAQRAALAIPFMNMARVHVAADRLDEAESMAQDALGAVSSGDVAEPAIRSLRADVCSLLASIFAVSHDFESAIVEQRAALAIRSALYGEGSADVVNTRSQLAALLCEIGEFEEADDISVAAAEATRAVFGELSEATRTALKLIADRRLEAGHRDDADRLDEAAFAIRRAGESSVLDVASEESDRAEQFAESGELGPAAQAFERAIAAVDSLGKALHPSLISLLVQAAMCQQALGNHATALRQVDRALSLLDSVEGFPPETREMPLAFRAIMLRDLGRFDEARRACAELRALRAERKALADGDLDTPLARVQADQGELEESSSDLKRLLAEVESGPAADSRESADLLSNLGFVEAQRGERSSGATCLRRSLQLIASSLLRESRQTNLESINSHFHARASAEALGMLASSGDAEPEAPIVVATAMHRASVLLGPSDLLLAAGKAMEHAPLVRSALRAERQLHHAIEESEDARKALAARRASVLRAKLDEAERALAEALPDFAARRLAWQCEPDRIAAALTPRGIFIQYARVSPPILERRKGFRQRYAPARYLAVVIGPDASRCVDLGPADRIDATALAACSGDERALHALSEALLDPIQPWDRSTIWIAAESALAEVPFEILPVANGRSLCDLTLVARVTSIGGLLLGRRPVVAAAADAPLSFAFPDLAPVVEPVREPLTLVAPPKPTWWRSLAERLGLASPPRPASPVISLALASPSTCEVSAALRADRHGLAESVDRAAVRPTDGRCLAGSAATVRALLGVRSPASLRIDAPWGLLPDQPYVWGDPKDQAWVLRMPPRAEPDATWHESPYARAAIYLACAEERDAGIRRRSPGALSARSLAGIDLSQTTYLALTRPPRTPRGGPVGDALGALADAALAAGARAFLPSRSWSRPEAIHAWLDAFTASQAAGAPLLECARKATLELRARGASPRDSAPVAVFAPPTATRLGA
jgi:hypothetical protein